MCITVYMLTAYRSIRNSLQVILDYQVREENYCLNSTPPV